MYFPSVTQADAFETRQREMQEQARTAEEGRKKNIELFERMFLSIGSDCVKLAGTRHDQELAEAKDRAAGRWMKLLSLEAQVQRDEQLVAARGKRPVTPGDKMLADEVIRRLDDEYEAATKFRRESVKQERDLAVATRKELESYIVKAKAG